MSTKQAGRCPFADMINVEDPWPEYAALREREGVVWDDSVSAWVAPTYELARTVLMDETRFVKPTTFRVIWGRSHLVALEGRQHARVRRWWQRVFSPKCAEQWRTSIVRPIVGSVLERFLDDGAADLASQYAKHVPIRVIAAVIGLPYQDDEWLEAYRVHNQAIWDFMFGDPFGLRPEYRDRALASCRAMDELLAPYVEARRTDPRDDVMSRLWSDGPEMFDDWGHQDMYDIIRNVFFGGTDTTMMATCNALKLLVDDQDLQQELRQEGRPQVERFVEESLRINTVVQYRSRTVVEDTTLGGAELRAGQTVLAVNAGANRDEAQFASAEDVVLSRRPLRNHLAFGVGASVCLGAPLARVEIQEQVSGLLGGTDSITWEPDGAAGRYQPGHQRAYAPLDVRFVRSLDR